MRRRDFLKRLAAGGAGLAGLSAFGIPQARAAGVWGSWPQASLAGRLPVERQAKNVLEVFVNGGLSPWESLYVVAQPEYGQEKGHQWWTFQETAENLTDAVAACGASIDAAPQDFRVDANGAMVGLGPFIDPLRQRTDIVDRLRLHVMTHDLAIHVAGIPLGATGFRLGSPKLAGLGTAVSHAMGSADLDPTGEPYSYVFLTPVRIPGILDPLAAVGRHPSWARPVNLRVNAGVQFAFALQRLGLGQAADSVDALNGYYLNRFRDRLTVGGVDARAPTLSHFMAAQANVENANVLAEVLEPALFRPEAADICGAAIDGHYTRVALQLAAHVLTRPGTRTKHVTVVDSGTILHDGGLNAYDTHELHIRRTAPNLHTLSQELAAIINEPGEGDPRKLNLDETLVVINTEFGRSPGPQAGTGRNHWPQAYVTAMFGGPVGVEQQGIVGAIGPEGFATNALQPTETRAAVLAALGLYPFEAEAYEPTDIVDVDDELEAARWLNEVVLGVTS